MTVWWRHITVQYWTSTLPRKRDPSSEVPESKDRGCCSVRILNPQRETVICELAWPDLTWPLYGNNKNKTKKHAFLSFSDLDVHAKIYVPLRRCSPVYQYKHQLNITSRWRLYIRIFTGGYISGSLQWPAIVRTVVAAQHQVRNVT